MCCLEANTSIKLMTRPSPYIAVFHQYSVNRKTSLSLRPVGRKLLAPACALACTGLITCKFTVHSDHHSVPLRMPFGYYYRPLPLYNGFLRLKAMCILGFPPSCWLPHQHPLGLFSHSERLLLRPEGPYFLMQTILRRMFLLAVSAFWMSITEHTQIHLQSILSKKS